MKTKKSTIVAVVIMVFAIMFISCGEEEFVGQPGTDGIAPGKIANVTSESIPGGAQISYSVPEDEDFSHVEAIYYANSENQRSSVSTKYIQNLTVEGFGNTNPQKVDLYAVDKSGNRSEKVTIEVTPLTPPHITLFESLKVRDDFSGVFLEWENERDVKNLGIVVLAYDEFGEFLPITSVYDNDQNERSDNIRGLDTLEIELGFYVKDKWDNISDTLVNTFKPLYETELDRTKRTGLKLDTDIPADNGSRDISKTYDGNLKQARWSGYTSTKDVNKNYLPHHVTYDMGETNLYSRFIYYPMWYDAFKLGGIEVFALYGTNEESLITRETAGAYDWNGDEDPNTSGIWKEYGMESSPDGEWNFIGEFVVPKTSGLPGTQYTQNCDNCDRDIAERGIEFQIPAGTPPYKYIRFQTRKLWQSSSKFSSFSELVFFGSPVSN